MEETKIVFLSDNRKVVLEDDDDIILSFVSDDKAESRFEVPYPSGGYGGGWLKLSPSKNYVVFSYFSGESEEGFWFKLFAPAHGIRKMQKQRKMETCTMNLGN